MKSAKAFGKLAVATFLLTLGTLVCSSLAWGQNSLEFPDFTATQVFTSGKADIAMKVYRAGSSVRVERSAALSTLYDPTSSKVYNLTTYPDKSHQCVAMKPEQAKMLPSPLELMQGKIVKRTTVGNEVVEGHAAKVENVVVARPDGKQIEFKVWQAEDLKGVPVKIEAHIDEVVLTAFYRDVVTGAADPSLFTAPEKCTPFEKMGQVAEMKVIK